MPEQSISDRLAHPPANPKDSFFAEWRSPDARREIIRSLDDVALASLFAIVNDLSASVLAEYDRRKVQDVITPKSTVYPT